jgi:hypothetical protein
MILVKPKPWAYLAKIFESIAGGRYKKLNMNDSNWIIEKTPEKAFKLV